MGICWHNLWVLELFKCPFTVCQNIKNCHFIPNFFDKYEANLNKITKLIKLLIALDSLSPHLSIWTFYLYFYLFWLKRYGQICRYCPIGGSHFEIQDGGHENEMSDCQPIFSFTLWIYNYIYIGWHMLPFSVITCNNSLKYILTNNHYKKYIVVNTFISIYLIIIH